MAFGDNPLNNETQFKPVEEGYPTAGKLNEIRL
jgi:hypothetical protein